MRYSSKFKMYFFSKRLGAKVLEQKPINALSEAEKYEVYCIRDNFGKIIVDNRAKYLT